MASRIGGIRPTSSGYSTPRRLSLHRPEIPDRPPGRDRFRRGDDRVRVDAVGAVEVGDRPGLAEMLYSERPHAVAGDRAEPAEGGRMAVEHRDQRAVARER